MSNERMQQTVAIPLSKSKRNLVQIGCICMMLSVSMYGLVFSTLTAPILESVNAMGYVGLFSIFAALGVSIMTPIGGKLGDIIGRRNIVVIPGILCVICGIAFAFVRSLVPLMVLRLLISLTQGAFTAAPFIIVGLINEKKDVPKAMGMLAAAVAVGGFVGSIVAGILTDMNMLTVAIIMPAVPLILGIVFIGLNMPNQKREGKVKIDVPGIIALVVTLCAILLSLNFGSSIGWLHPVIIGGFVLGIAALFALIKIEAKADEPIIPLSLFKNKNYTILLVVGFAGYFYQNAMNVYGPIAAMQVMGKSASITGALQMPRTILTIVVPIIAGTWVGKKTSNMWKAMVLATALAGIPMIVLGFTSTTTPIMLYFVALAVTGIAESFRSVSITPAAQSMLSPEEMGVGTSFVNFFNSLSGTIGATVFAVAYNMNTAADPTNVELIQKGVNSVYWVAGIVGIIGLVIVILFVRPQMSDKKEQTETTEEKCA
ncbi:MFS transporter [Intestinibacter sp.]|uniref:MFS transporter n=1 Tax=Intestinibacter sp. TaxID=1965304 RepID=UPI002A90C0B6|nr:MFS transporter [Intestinibacter sp.]MDY5211991.1 MFS transporter [Intestinibacter sp.]